MTHPTPFMMSIEPANGDRAFRHGFHLGTDERIARQFCEERLHKGINPPARSVALLDAKGKIVDVYDGAWSSEYRDF